MSTVLAAARRAASAATPAPRDKLRRPGGSPGTKIPLIRDTATHNDATVPQIKPTG
jgi:hypothetical protein